MDIPAPRPAPPEEDGVAGTSAPGRPQPVAANRPRFDVTKVLWLG